MKNVVTKAILCLALIIYILPTSALAAEQDANEESVSAVAQDVQVGSRLWELLFGGNDEPHRLCPGGGVFGIKIKQSAVTVVESKGIPALSAGDVIISINGKKIQTAEQMREAISESGGKSLTIRALHGDSEISIEVQPALIDGEYKLGVSLRDGAAGIGTITFIDPKTGRFGGLGHGICDSDSGRVIEMEQGEICEVILGGIHKGEAGKPGELCGILTGEHMGVLSGNNECGVFGRIEVDENALPETLEIGTRDGVHDGEATIISTLKNGMRAEYRVKIFDVDRTSTGTKSFRVKVTDPMLIALTGGIVRGMSGSPIIQDGKLVGAVTHVMVADPTEGYGLFIENMLNAAQSQVQPKAA